MSGAPEVSVVLPVRNAAGTLGEAITSVLAQRGVALELLVVDDSSSDRSTEVAAGFRDPRLRRTGNRHAAGVVGAFRSGLAEARGSWVARMDADDVAHPERLARQLVLGREGGFDVVSCGVRVVEAQGDGMRRYVDWVNSLRDHAAMSRARFIECPVINPSALVRAEVLRRAGGYHERTWAEDHDLWLRLLADGARFGKVVEPLLDWRDSPGRLTRTDPRYGERARMAMRAEYLGALDAVARRGVAIAGAGPQGKSLAKALLAAGVSVHGFFEVHPGRIGQRIHGLPVRGPERFERDWREAVLLGAVGVPGGRERVRKMAGEAGRREGEDFWAVC